LIQAFSAIDLIFWHSSGHRWRVAPGNSYKSVFRLLFLQKMGSDGAAKPWALAGDVKFLSHAADHLAGSPKVGQGLGGQLEH
jgi:hypothetical protein